MKLKIFTKVLVMVMLSVTVTSAGVFVTAKYFMDRAFDHESREAIKSARTVVENHINSLQSGILRQGLLIAGNHGLVEAVLAEDATAIKNLIQKAMADTATDFVTICDAQGNVLARAHADKAGDNVGGQFNVRRALGGEPVVGLEPGAVIKFSLRAACPLWHDGRVVGAVQLGVSLSENSFVDDIKKFTGLEVTIFEKDTRLVTTIMRDGQRAIGTRMDNPRVIDTVLSRGETYLARNTILGQPYETVYWPIRDPEDQVAGMYFVGKPLAYIMDVKQDVTLAILGVSTVLVMVMVGLGVWFAASLTRPITETTGFASRVAAGDLEQTLAVRAGGEIGTLAEALRSMVAKLKEMIWQAELKTREAEEKSRLAEAATQEAHQARQQAEQARRQGMLDAASRIDVIVERVTSASEQLAAQVEQSSRGTEIQRERTAETSTAMEEMNASVMEVARNASDAAANADQAREEAQGGAAEVRHVVAAITDVRALAGQMKESLGKLGLQATGIGQVMDVISDIADQTNLLALNAAIEAARAGDAGRGFAVVADEVRKLAEKTMHATKEVGEAIAGIQARTTENISRMGQTEDSVRRSTELAALAGEALGRIVERAESTADRVRAIATASEEQSAASEEISRGTDEVNRIAVETAEAMAQSAQAVAELARMAQDLRNVVDELKSA